MKKDTRSLSTILLAAVLAGGLHAASDTKKRENRSASERQRQQQTASQSTPELTNENIQSAVEKKLAKLDAIDTSQLQTEINDGTVTVTGTVSNLIESDRILETVSAVRGVEGVITNLTVEPEQRSDREIQRDVNAALDFDPATASKDISVSVNNAEVRLTGKAETWADKQLATWIASDVRGVRKIRNDLTLTSEQRSDASIADALKKRFRSDPLVSDDISVTVKNSRVRLSGEVGSALEKRWAISDARALNVANVDASQLRVNAESRSSVSRSDSNLSDDEIADAIVNTYLHDPRVFSFNPDVTVDNGIVTLSGTVDNLKARQAAVQIAQNTSGVKQVKDNLSIRRERLPDNQVAENLRDALERSPLVDAENVDINVSNGTVTLTGDVDSNFEKWSAGDIAARTRGVTDVRNRLMPDDLPERTTWRYYYPWHSSFFPRTYSNSEEPMTDGELRAEVRDQLAWSPFTDAEDISISVSDGVVTLTGQVDNRMEKGAAEDNAYQAGATQVKNQLVVLEPTGR